MYEWLTGCCCFVVVVYLPKRLLYLSYQVLDNDQVFEKKLSVHEDDLYSLY